MTDLSEYDMRLLQCVLPLAREAKNLDDEVKELRALVRKIRGGVMWWAALSYIDGWGERKSRWTEKEQALLRRAMEDK